MDLNVGVNGVWLFGREPAGGHGFVIDPDGLEGLDDGLGVRGDSVARPQAHGDFDVPTFFEPRIVALSGTCVAGSAQKLGWFRDQFKTMLVNGGRVSFDHLGTVRWGDARLAPGTQPKFKVDSGDSLSARFQIQLKFANPRLFGETRTFAAGTPAHHFGNFAATPVHTVTGVNASGYTINGPDGKTFTVSRAVTAGVPHVIDMATGLLKVGGAVVVGAVTSGDLWAIPGGAQVTHALTGSGLTLSTAVTDTYV